VPLETCATVVSHGGRDSDDSEDDDSTRDEAGLRAIATPKKGGARMRGRRSLSLSLDEASERRRLSAPWQRPVDLMAGVFGGIADLVRGVVNLLAGALGRALTVFCTSSGGERRPAQQEQCQ
jgi:hypothetical protein